MACNVRSWGPAGPECGGETVTRLVMTCAHQHLEADEHCADHADMLAHGEVWCSPCGRRGHICRSWPVAEYDQGGNRRDLRGKR
ncbi:hypothetical protein [Nonomuraea sp. NPDC005650]|uniref:hypothetical protein n=1 Tax=Nonomuraea sp. NPDC005650 TaxID=3157045 RepID=UPI0033AE1C7C